MRILRICMLIAVALMLPARSAVATPLPSADWYAVIWARGQDAFYWVNREGVIASLPRPLLDQEAAGATIRLNISRDGRYMLLAGDTISGNQALGIYDLRDGGFTGSLTAQPGIEIHPGAVLATSKDGTRAAVAFVAADANDDNWQLITFDLPGGSPLAILDSSHVSGQYGSAPSHARVRRYQTLDDPEPDRVHFQLWPKTGQIPPTAPTFSWSPGADGSALLQPSSLERASADFNALTEEEVFAFQVGDLPFTPFTAVASTDNAIGTLAATSADAEIETIYYDRQRFLSQPLWAKGGEWIAVFTESGEEGVTVGWQILSLADLERGSGLVVLPANVREVHGTPDGLLAVTTGGELRHVASLNDTAGSLLYPQLETGLELIQIIYVSKAPYDFALTELAGATES